MKELDHTYVTAYQFQHKQSQKGVYGSWICIFLYEYIWKSVYWSVYLNIQMIFCSSVLLACFS